MILIVEILLSVAIAGLIHELGHYVAALAFGSRLHFEFSWGELFGLRVPRWTWQWPNVTPERLRIICQAGFVAELALVPLLPWSYQVVALAHFALYPWYAGECSDFRGMV